MEITFTMFLRFIGWLLLIAVLLFVGLLVPWLFLVYLGFGAFLLITLGSE